MMRASRLLFCALLASVTVLGAGKATQPPSHPLLQSETVVWAGLDYSLVRMYGTQDFRDPDNIFPRFLNSWNALFLKERIKPVGSALKKRVETDTASMEERNKTATKDQVIRQDGDLIGDSHIGATDIANAVRSYKLSQPGGLGLAFVVDRLVKSQGRGAVYLVFFDIATREVIASERVIGKANGVGFRNYWFGVIKSAEVGLKKYR